VLDLVKRCRLMSLNMIIFSVCIHHVARDQGTTPWVDSSCALCKELTMGVLTGCGLAGVLYSVSIAREHTIPLASAPVRNAMWLFYWDVTLPFMNAEITALSADPKLLKETYWPGIQHVYNHCCVELAKQPAA
jgi:hypothetical protein